MRKILFLGVILSLFLAMPAEALSPAVAFSAAGPLSHKTFKLPEIPEISSRLPVVSLGKVFDAKSQTYVEGLAIIHYWEDFARSGNGKALAATCYSFLANGAKWKAVEPWIVNPTNQRGLDSDFILANLTVDISKWEDAADGKVGNNRGVNILGSGTATSSPLLADTKAPDGLNEVYFANISNPGVIAVAIVWGIFSGPTSKRKLIEWDQVYDDVDFDWSASGEAGKMDFENIATHELGHSVGMADLYSKSCAKETMYGYATLGETLKRDLNTGDISGINILY